MPDTPLMLSELSVAEQRYRAVSEIAAGADRGTLLKCHDPSTLCCIGSDA